MRGKDGFKYSLDLGLFSWQYQDFDSKILERNVAKINYIKAAEKSNSCSKLIRELSKSLQENKIEYATYRLRASDFLMIHTLEQEGFRLVDGIMRLEQVLTEPLERIGGAIRKALRKDVESLQYLASETFSETRFYNDPLIKKYQADKIYGEWIKNSVAGSVADMVFLWEEREGPVGFVTLRKTDGSIVLIAVSKNYQGRGIGEKLVKKALYQFMIWGLKKATVETQTTNIPALRLYQLCGYKIVDSYLTFRWSNR